MTESIPPGKSDIARVPKACRPCAQAKVRCEIELGDETCKRCRRLKKTCNEQAPGAHRRKIAKTFEVSRLEEKLDGVAAILAASQKPQFEGGTFSGSANLVPTVWIDQFIKSGNEADMILHTYRIEMAPFFPFVVIPNMPFTDLREKNPYLVLAILMVGCRHDPGRQSAIAQKIREIISYSMLIKGEKSLDMIQCLLIYLNWYHLHIHLGAQMCNHIHLVMALMLDLGLNRESPPRYTKSSFGELGHMGKDGAVPLAKSISNRSAKGSSPTKTLEERRTFLGCFFLTSIVSMYVRDIEPIRYSKYVDDCCQVISEAFEHPADLHVVYLTRLCSVGDKIKHMIPNDDWYMKPTLNSTPILNSAPTSECTKLLESELMQLRSSLPEEIHHNAVLLVYHHGIEIFLYESALNDDIEPSRYDISTRLSMLYACLNSTKLCFEQIYALSLTEWFNISHPIWSLLGHTVTVLSRLSLLKLEGWDQEYVRSIVDFSAVMDRLTEKFHEAKAFAENSPQQADLLPRVLSQIFLTSSVRLQRLKAAHQAAYAAQRNTIDLSLDFSSTETISTSTDDEFSIPSTSFFEFLDDNFWQQT